MPASPRWLVWKNRLAIATIVFSVLGILAVAIDLNNLTQAMIVVQGRIDAYPLLEQVPVYLLKASDDLKAGKTVDCWGLVIFAGILIGSIALRRHWVRKSR